MNKNFLFNLLQTLTFFKEEMMLKITNILQLVANERSWLGKTSSKSYLLIVTDLIMPKSADFVFPITHSREVKLEHFPKKMLFFIYFNVIREAKISRQNCMEYKKKVFLQLKITKC